MSYLERMGIQLLYKCIFLLGAQYDADIRQIIGVVFLLVQSGYPWIQGIYQLAQDQDTM